MADNLPDDIPATYICLKCKQLGHQTQHCTEEQWKFWTQIQGDQSFLDSARWAQQDTDITCQRCQDIDVTALLQQHRSLSGQIAGLADGEEIKKFDLGAANDVIFTSTCGLCRCLFAMCPDPRDISERYTLVPRSTLYRVEGSIDPGQPEFEGVADALSIDVGPAGHQPRDQYDHAYRQALCFVEEDGSDYSFGGRIVSSDRVDTKIIPTWVDNCTRNHPETCRSPHDSRLEAIWLIDVQTRIIVPYPDYRPEYCALSYCWGGASQPRIPKAGTLPEKLPQTIEDAITLVGMINKRFLWVDSVCIDQDSLQDQVEQFQLMNAIYQGAWLTIVALSGLSATSGLPRIGKQAHVRPQMRCIVHGKRMVGIAETLAAVMFLTSWSRRAWTFREALLSHRCLYLADREMYFECNASQCCESLNESRSWLHHAQRDQRFMRERHCDALVGTGVLRAPMPGTRRLVQYGTLFSIFTARRMTRESDALNAFTGIINYFEEKYYPQGFFWGLPVEDLNWSLCWCPEKALSRRSGFPAWSWAGWLGHIYGMYPQVEWAKPHEYPVAMRIWKMEMQSEGQDTAAYVPRLLFEQSCEAVSSAAKALDKDACAAFSNTHALVEIQPATVSRSEESVSRQIYISAVSISFDHSLDWIRLGASDAFYCFVHGMVCEIQVSAYMERQIFEHGRQRIKDSELEFLVMAREKEPGEGHQWLWYHLLVVRKCGETTEHERLGVMMLLVPMDGLPVFEHLNMQMAHVILD